MDVEVHSYTYDENYIYLRIPDPHSRKGVTVRKIKKGNSLAESDIETLAAAWIRTVIGYPLTTTLFHIKSLKSLTLFLHSTNTKLPTESNWQNFVCDFFEFFLIDKSSSKANLKTRMNEWTSCNSLLQTLQNQRTIPDDVIIPQATLKNNPYKSAPDSKEYVVGEKITDPGTYSETNNDLFYVDLTYALDSDNYFERLSNVITDRLSAIQLGAYHYWDAVKSYHELGRQLIENIDHQEFKQRLSSNNFLYQNPEGTTDHLINSENGLAWLLKYIEESLIDNPLQTNINSKCIAEGSFLSQLNLKKSSLNKIINKCVTTTKPKVVLENISTSETLTKLLGYLHHRDCACLATILIHEHPEITPTAIINANITSSRGKIFLYTRNSNNTRILSTSKPRASKRVNSVLTEKSKEILDDIIRLTSKIRLALKDRGLASKRLFLTATRYGYGAATNVIAVMNSSPHCITLYETIRQFLPLPFDKETFSLSRIRNSQGLLTWLKNGSPVEMAARLSNTPSVILRHYLPSWLVKKWNERTIRRYQQTLILLAAYKSPWLLDASEFRTTTQLLQFITNIVENSKTGDPLGDLIQLRLGPLVKKDPANEKKELLIKLSTDTLCTIFSYTERIDRNLPITTHESAIHSLSVLIKETLSQTATTPAEHAVKTKIQGDYFDSFKQMYFEAIAKTQLQS